MISEVQLLMQQYAIGKISREDFLRFYFKDNIQKEDFCIDMLKQAYLCKDAEKVEEVIFVVFVAGFRSKKFSSVLCDLLQSDWHYKHEDIALLLKDINDPTTVPCIKKSAGMQLAYLDYDDTYQFARKCIKALSSIGNAEAVEALKYLAKSEIPEIAVYARKELDYKGI